jgi:Secretion system C-terminal sorting domain
MQEKTTLTHGKLIRTIGLFLTCFLMATSGLKAQQFCANEVKLFTEDFGIGGQISHPDIINLTYQPTGVMDTEAKYRIINSSRQKDDWQNTGDHTTPTNANGRMAVINGEQVAFYQKVVNRPTGFAAGFYSASAFVLNANALSTFTICGPNTLLVQVGFILEYQNPNGAWVAFNGSPVNTANVPITAAPVWKQVGGVFTLPVTSFPITNVRMTLRDNTPGGCGNDFAIDDISLATCPSGGPLPVEFLGITATQKGSGVNVEWSTSSEVNNKSFEIEKSTDAGLSWNVFDVIKGNGNSNVVIRYKAYDPKPVSGLNYYRIKQLDVDGRFKYSATVTVKITIDKISVSVLQNPFVNKLTVDFLSPKNQNVSVRLFDIAGKKVSGVTWTLAKGNTRKELADVNNIKDGMYILSIVDDGGAVIYNGKLIKQ